MNDNAKMWMNALRSGEYEQGLGSLKNGNKFCCMGVACDLYSKSVGHGIWREFDGEGIPNWFEVPGLDDSNEVGSDVFLPEIVMEWLGMQDNSGKFFYYEDNSTKTDDDIDGDSLVDMNDTNSTFEDIAKIIEEEPRGLFKE